MVDPNGAESGQNKTHRAPDRNSPRRRALTPQPFDEADWVDWDHWQTVEEIQNFMNGLSGAADSSSEMVEEDFGHANAATQIRKHGLQAGE